MNTNDWLHAELGERFAAITADRRHGAAELARQCLALLADAAAAIPASDVTTLGARLDQLAEQLAATRPSMTPVLTLIAAWRECLRDTTPRSVEQLRIAANDKAQRLIDESRQAGDEAAAHAARLLARARLLVTYSCSSTVTAALIGLPQDVQLVISEARPLYEGYRLAQMLSQHGRAATLVTDAQLGSWTARADAVLVGADSVLADGAVVNKAGTLLIASTACCFDVPFYACCDSFKLRDAAGPELVLESMSPDELGAPDWPRITPGNVYFDITPPRLVTSLITENGVQTFPGYRGDARPAEPD